MCGTITGYICGTIIIPWAPEFAVTYALLFSIGSAPLVIVAALRKSAVRSFVIVYPLTSMVAVITSILGLTNWLSLFTTITLVLTCVLVKLLLTDMAPERADSELCKRCGYNLRGNKSGICSECGQPMTGSLTSPGFFRRNARRLETITFVFMGLLLFLVVIRANQKSFGKGSHRQSRSTSPETSATTGHILKGNTSPSDSESKRRVIKSLAARPRIENLGVLTAALGDPDPWVRMWAAIALGRLKDDSAIPLLCPLLRDPEPQVRSNAVQALGMLDHKKVDFALSEMISKGGSADIVAAIDAIGKVGSNAILPLVVSFVEDPRVEVRDEAVLALATMSGIATPHQTRQAALTTAWEWWRSTGQEQYAHPPRPPP